MVWGQESQRERLEGRGLGDSWGMSTLLSLFAVVSNDCHVRNARARTMGLGMLPSETSLADRIWNLPLSNRPFIHLYILSAVHLNLYSLGVFLASLSQSITPQNGNFETTKEVQSHTWYSTVLAYMSIHQKLETSQIILSYLIPNNLRTRKEPRMALIMNHIMAKYYWWENVYGSFSDKRVLKWQKVRDSHRDATSILNVRLCQACTTKQSYRHWVIPKLSLISWNPVRRTCGSGIYNPASVNSIGSDIAAPSEEWALM